MPEHIARGILIEGEKILLCNNLEGGHYFLPGGHVEEGEKAEDALAREMIEESNRSIVKTQYLTTFDNEYDQNGIRVTEKLDVFLAWLVDGPDIKSKENHIAFEWIGLEEFPKVHFLPKHLVSDILQVISDNKDFL